MPDDIERDLGEQPVGKLMELYGLRSADLVKSSTEQLTFKMVSRAVNGRRLTPNVQHKILNALNIAAGKKHRIEDLFNYR